MATRQIVTIVIARLYGCLIETIDNRTILDEEDRCDNLKSEQIKSWWERCFPRRHSFYTLPER